MAFVLLYFTHRHHFTIYDEYYHCLIFNVPVSSVVVWWWLDQGVYNSSMKKCTYKLLLCQFPESKVALKNHGIDVFICFWRLHRRVLLSNLNCPEGNEGIYCFEFLFLLASVIFFTTYDYALDIKVYLISLCFNLIGLVLFIIYIFLFFVTARVFPLIFFMV